MNCPFCKDALDADITVCGRCNAQHHTECWNSYAKCTSCRFDRPGTLREVASICLRRIYLTDYLLCGVVDLPVMGWEILEISYELFVLSANCLLIFLILILEFLLFSFDCVLTIYD